MGTSGKKKLRRTCKANLCIVRNKPIASSNNCFKRSGGSLCNIITTHTQIKRIFYLLIASPSTSSASASATASATTVNARMCRAFSTKSLLINFSLLCHSLKNAHFCFLFESIRGHCVKEVILIIRAMPRSFAVCSLALSNFESMLSKSKASVGTTALCGKFWFDTLPKRPPLPPLGCGILPPAPLPPCGADLSGGGGFGFDVGKPTCAAAAKLVGFTYAGFAASR